MDNDALLTKRAGASLIEIAAVGEKYLHDEESAQLRAAAALMPPFVAGVGASVADRMADLELLRDRGVVVYLRARPETIVGRLGTEPGRPWVQQHPLEWITAMLARRQDAYRGAADIVIDVDSMTPREAAGRVWEELPLPAMAWALKHPHGVTGWHLSMR